MQVPLLSIVKIPTLAIDDMNITFDMEVKSAESSESSSDKEGSLDANAKIGFQYARGIEKEYAVLGKEIVGRDTSIIGKICPIALQM